MFTAINYLKAMWYNQAEIGQRIYNKRVEKGISLDLLAEAAGMSKPTLLAIEKKRNSIASANNGNGYDETLEDDSPFFLFDSDKLHPSLSGSIRYTTKKIPRPPTPNLTQIFQLSAVLGCDPEYLLCLQDEEDTDASNLMKKTGLSEEGCIALGEYLINAVTEYYRSRDKNFSWRDLVKHSIKEDYFKTLLIFIDYFICNCENLGEPLLRLVQWHHVTEQFESHPYRDEIIAAYNVLCENSSMRFVYGRLEFLEYEDYSNAQDILRDALKAKLIASRKCKTEEASDIASDAVIDFFEYLVFLRRDPGKHHALNYFSELLDDFLENFDCLLDDFKKRINL